MAARRTPQERLKEAVERTVEAGQVTRGSMDELVQGTRDRATSAVEDLAQRAERVRGAIEGSRPATRDDVDEVRKELRAIVRRLDKIEKRLPAKKK